MNNKKQFNVDTLETYTKNTLIDLSLFKRDKDFHKFLKANDVIYNLYDYNCLKLFINPKQILHKDILFDTDYYLFEKVLNDKLLFNLVIDDLILNRIDFCRNFEVIEPFRTILFESILPKTSGARYKKCGKYKRTMYFNQKQLTNIIYDKGLEQEERFQIEEYKDTIRLETRLNRFYLQKHKEEYPRTINAYWDSIFADYIIYKRYKDILYIGDYYTAYDVRKILKNAEFKQGMIDKIINFQNCISKYGIDETKRRYGNKFYSYKNRLEQLEINPILLPKNNIWNVKSMPGFLTSKGFRQELLSNKNILKQII